MRLQFRSVWPEDLDVLVALTRRADATYRAWAPGWEPPGTALHYEDWPVKLADPAGWNVAAFLGEALVGTVSVSEARENEGEGLAIPGLGHLSRLFVDPDHWGRGIGDELLRRAVEEMHHRGYQAAQLFTGIDNERSRRFYERRGWHEAGGPTDHHWHELPLVRYSLDLRTE